MDRNLAHVLGIQFAVHGAGSTSAGTCPDNQCKFDFWVDQVEFF